MNGNAKISLLLDIVQAVDDLGLAIVSGYHDYPRDIQSDVDAIGSQAVLETLKTSVRNNRFGAVQVIQHESTCYYWVFHRMDEQGKPAFLRFDYSTDYRRDGRVFHRFADMLPHLSRMDKLPILEPALEFSYYIVKKVGKGEIEPHHADLLTQLYRQDPQGCRAELTRYFPEAGRKVILDAVESGQWFGVRERLPEIRCAMFRKAASDRPWDALLYPFGEFIRRVKRVLHPTGLVVVILGADGSGKSTIAEQVSRDLLPAFRRKRIVHLRPALRKRQSEGPVTDPHGQPPRGFVGSLVKIFYWWSEYVLGWLLDIYPSKIRSTLVLFDRYYQDLLVDPKRYRYGGPSWFADLMQYFIPRPDLFILLDLPAETSLARKAEVTLEEARRLRERYLALQRKLPNAHVVDASRSIPEVVTAVEQVILEHLEQRTKKWMGA